MTWHRPRSGSLKTRPIKSVPSRVGEGRFEVGDVGSGGGRSDSAKWKKWEVGKGEGDACGAGGDDIDAVTTVVGEGGAKIEGSVPVRVP